MYDSAASASNFRDPHACSRPGCGGAVLYFPSTSTWACNVCGAVDDTGPEEVYEAVTPARQWTERRNRNARPEESRPGPRPAAPAGPQVALWPKYLQGLQCILRAQCDYAVGVLGCQGKGPGDQDAVFTETVWRLWQRGRDQRLGAVGSPPAPPGASPEREREFLRKVADAVPVSDTLSAVFLACCLLREAVLPQDLYLGCVSGEFPFLAAHAGVPRDVLDVMPASTRKGALLQPIEVPTPCALAASAAAWAREVWCGGTQAPPPLRINLSAILARFAIELALPPFAVQHALRLYQAHDGWMAPRLQWMDLRTHDGHDDVACFTMALLVVALRFYYPLIGRPGAPPRFRAADSALVC